MAAPTYQSTQTNTGSGSVVITKPTSLAVGDLMIAGIFMSTDNGNGSSSTPSGWTIKGSQSGGFGTFYLFWKIATSGDVAASNFTWTNTGTGTKASNGSITRITGTDTVAPVDQLVMAAQGGGGSAFTIGDYTPSRPDTLCFIFTECSNSGATRTVSGYAYSNSNPTWTEAFDLTGASPFGGGMGFSMAYGTRAASSAIGGASATASGTAADFLVSMTTDIMAPASAVNSGFFFAAAR